MYAHGDAGGRPAAAARVQQGRCAEPVAVRVGAVEQQPGGAVVVRDDQVRVAVVVHVAGGQTAADERRLPVEQPGSRRFESPPARAVGHVQERLVRLIQGEGIVFRPRPSGGERDGAVDRREVEPAVVVEVDEGGAEGRRVPARPAEAGCVRAVPKLRGAGLRVVPVEGVRLAVEVGQEQVEVAVSVVVAGGDAHARLGLAVRVESRAADQTLLDQCAVAAVEPEVIRQQIVRDVEVEPAVAVEVGREDAQPVAGSRRAQTGRDRRVLESSVAVVEQQAVRRRPVGARQAVVHLSPFGQAGLVRGQGEVEVVHDEQVEIEVAVVVGGRRRDAPARVAGAARLGPVAERAVALVAPELVPAQVQDVEVHPAVVVEVGRHHAHAVAEGRDAALLGDVDEADRGAAIGELQVVAVQAVPRRPVAGPGGGRGRPVSFVPQEIALDQVEVEIAVVVVVEERRAGADHLRIVEAPAHAVPVPEVEAGAPGGVGEPDFALSRPRGAGQGRRCDRNGDAGSARCHRSPPRRKDGASTRSRASARSETR